MQKVNPYQTLSFVALLFCLAVSETSIADTSVQRRRSANYVGKSSKEVAAARPSSLRRESRKQRRTRQKSQIEAKNRDSSSYTLSGHTGLVLGDVFDGTILAYGADAGFKLSERLIWDSGALYWQHSSSGTYSTSTFSLLHLDTGPRYQIPVNDSGSFVLDLGGRIGMGLATFNVSGSEELETLSSSKSAPMGLLTMGFAAKSGSLFGGLQFRNIVFSDGDMTGSSVQYLLASVGLQL